MSQIALDRISQMTSTEAAKEIADIERILCFIYSLAIFNLASAGVIFYSGSLLVVDCIHLIVEAKTSHETRESQSTLEQTDEVSKLSRNVLFTTLKAIAFTVIPTLSFLGASFLTYKSYQTNQRDFTEIYLPALQKVASQGTN